MINANNNANNANNNNNNNNANNDNNDLISKILIQNNVITQLTNTCNEYRNNIDSIKSNNIILLQQVNEYHNKYQSLQYDYHNIETKLSSLSLLYDKLIYNNSNSNDMINVELSSKLVISQQNVDLKDIEIGNATTYITSNNVTTINITTTVLY